MVAGSGNTEQGDENAAVQPADGLTFTKSVSGGYEEAIPGPVTRLLVIANRGLANLIQDLILVSERKAKALGAAVKAAVVVGATKAVNKVLTASGAASRHLGNASTGTGAKAVEFSFLG